VISIKISLPLWKIGLRIGLGPGLTWTRPFVLRNLLAVVLAGWSSANAQAEVQVEPLQVLHWWNSASEHSATDVLAVSLAEENVAWQEQLIPSGSGVGAIIVLKSRVLAGDAPDVAQLNGPLISEWADLGLLLDLDKVAESGKWDKLLMPKIAAWIRPRGHVVVAPLGIHRVNTLFYNRKIFVQYGLQAPQTWDDFERVAAKLHQAGIPALAQSSEPWQIATLFETLVLAEGGSNYFRDLFIKKYPDAYSDPRFGRALKRLRNLKQWMATPNQELSWPEVTRQFADGGAAMMVMGDWAKGEMNAWGLATDSSFGCIAAPGTADYHLFDIDTLAMFATKNSHRSAQLKLAQVTMSAAVQNSYNQIKGSIPVLRNPDLSKMDSCARLSWNVFSKGSSAQVPSFAHRMATDETSRDAIIGEVVRYYMDDQITIQDTQRRLVSVARILTKIGLENNAQDTHR
jgi:glucose/mannose transport system substrate-binding protein